MTTTTATRIKDVQGAGTKDATGRTISGGQFYHSRDGGPSAPAVTLQSFKSQSTVNDSFPFPQANDLEKIVTVVDAVASNADTSAAIADTIGVTAEREGTYYADAAGYLGLVETSSVGGLRTYELTELGEHLQLADATERADLMRQLVSRVPAVEEYTYRGEDGLAEFMEEETELSGSTLERRAATIASWYKASISGEELTGKISDQRAGADDRVLAAAARASVARQEAAERAKPAPAAICTEHFVELPVSGICDMCE